MSAVPAIAAADFAEALVRLGCAFGMTADVPSPHTNALYQALAAHLGWFHPRAVRAEMRAALPRVPDAHALACVLPEQSFSPGTPAAWWDLACGCIARGPRGDLGLAIASRRLGVTVIVDASGMRTRAWSAPVVSVDARPATAPWSSLVGLLSGETESASLTLSNWPAEAPWTGPRPTTVLATALRLLCDRLDLVVANTFGETAWSGVATAFVARTPAALAARLHDAPATRALPGEPCPRCGATLLDPDRARRTPPLRSPRDDDVERWCMSGVSPTCAGCHTRFQSPNLREVNALGETVAYRRSNVA